MDIKQAAGAPGNTKSVGAVAVTFYSATAQSSLTRMLAAPRQPGPGPGDWRLDGDNSGYSVHQSCHDKERGSRAAGGQPLARDMRLLGHGVSMRKRYNLQVASEECI